MLNNRLLPLVLALILIAVGVWWWNSNREPAPISPPAISSNAVSYTASGFSPGSLNVSEGTTVTFRNNSSREVWPASARHPTHDVYDGTSMPEHCPNADNSAFDACGGVPPGGMWSFTFEKTGEWRYHDHLNPSMSGMVVVQ